ncbi:MAG: MerR family transcriptional regulator [Rhizobiaceae bacterium]
MTTASYPPANSTDLTLREKHYRIRELAEEFEISLRTLRFYEDRGLIRPARLGQARYYSEKDREQLRICLLCKQSGMALADIEHVLKLHATNDDRKSHRSELVNIYVSQLAALRKLQARTKLNIAELRGEIDRLRGIPVS